MRIPFPHICAWCGSKYPISMRLVKFQEEKLTGFYIVASTRQISTYSITLPICAECDTQLKHSRKLFKLSCVIGGFLGAITGFGIGLWLRGFEIFFCSMDIVLGVTAGVIAGMIFGKIKFQEKKWGRVINGSYDFYNADFRNALIALLKEHPPQQDNTMQYSNNTFKIL